MARYGSEHRGRTHERIIDGASAMIRERGLDKASVAEVMKAAGLTVGGFYAQFTDKDAMLAEAMTRAIGQSPPRIRKLVNMARAAGDAGLVARYYLSRQRVEDISGGCAAAALVSELHRAPEPVRAGFMEGSLASARELAGLAGDDLTAPDWASYTMLVGALSMIRAAADETTREAIRDDVIAALRQRFPDPPRHPIPDVPLDDGAGSRE